MRFMLWAMAGKIVPIFVKYALFWNLKSCITYTIATIGKLKDASSPRPYKFSSKIFGFFLQDLNQVLVKKKELLSIDNRMVFTLFGSIRGVTTIDGSRVNIYKSVALGFNACRK